MAMGPTHALSGVVVFATGAPTFAVMTGHPLTAELLILGTATMAGAAMLPDIDHPDAGVSRSLGWLSGAFSFVVAAVSGGHRKGTHSLAGCAVFTVLAALAVATRDTIPGKVGLGALLALLLSAAIRVMKIPGKWDDHAGVAVAIPLAYAAPDMLTVLPWAVALGTLTHLAGDLPTEVGCPVLWPLTSRRFRAPTWLRFRVNGPVEHRVIVPALWTGLVLAAGWHTGLVTAVVIAVTS